MIFYGGTAKRQSRSLFKEMTKASLCRSFPGRKSCLFPKRGGTLVISAQAWNNVFQTGGLWHCFTHVKWHCDYVWLIDWGYEWQHLGIDWPQRAKHIYFGLKCHPPFIVQTAPLYHGVWVAISYQGCRDVIVPVSGSCVERYPEGCSVYVGGLDGEDEMYPEQQLGSA